MYQKPDQAFINYDGYRWGRLNQIYRGPRPDLSAPYIACLGGAQTFGRYVARPYPALLGEALGVTAANFGAGSAGPGFFLRDSTVLEAASAADLCVIQVMSARSLSNRLFKVQLGKNAQIEAVSRALESLFPHVDFETFTYAHNMLNQIAEEDPDKFLTVEAELKEAWVARMRVLLDSIDTKRVLFWFSERSPDHDPADGENRQALQYPQFVDQEMLDAVTPMVDRVVRCVSSAGVPQSLLREGRTVLQTPFGMPISENRYYPSPEMHEAAAAALAGPVRELLDSDLPPTASRPGYVSI
ncbi:MAG: DUF6473 family protein [Pikeienuella sp.]